MTEKIPNPVEDLKMFLEMAERGDLTEFVIIARMGEDHQLRGICATNRRWFIPGCLGMIEDCGGKGN